jgi:vacuolar-type H+-ATPase subunit H
MLNEPISKDTEHLLAEADELIRQINADALNEMEEEHRLQFEIHTQKLEAIKSEVRARARVIRKTHRKQAPARRAFMKRFLILSRPCRD